MGEGHRRDLRFGGRAATDRGAGRADDTRDSGDDGTDRCRSGLEPVEGALRESRSNVPRPEPCPELKAVMACVASRDGGHAGGTRSSLRPMDRPLRVIQWTTGNIGRRSLHAIPTRPDLELAGVYAHGKDKVGRDAAELCGWREPTGVPATDDVAALLALGADACCYNPLWPSVDELRALLEAGVNVCASAAWITGGAEPGGPSTGSARPASVAARRSSAAAPTRA